MSISKIISFHPYARAHRYISVGAALGRFATAMKRRAAQRSAMRTLSRLSDHQLRDIGIERHLIREAVVGAASEKKFPAPAKAIVMNLTDHMDTPASTERLAA